MKSPAIFRIDVQVRVLRLRATAATNGIISFLEPRHGVRRLDGSSLCLTSSRVTGSRNGGDRVHGIVRRAVRNCCCASDVTDSNKKLLQHVIRGSGRARAGGGFGSLEDWRAHDIIAAHRHDAKKVSCFRQVRVPHDAMIMQNARGLLLRYFERCHCRSPASAWGQVKAGGQTTEGRFHFCRRKFSISARSRRTRSAGRASTRSERPSSLPEAHPGTQGTYVL